MKCSFNMYKWCPLLACGPAIISSFDPPGKVWSPLFIWFVLCFRTFFFFFRFEFAGAFFWAVYGQKQLEPIPEKKTKNP